MDCIAALRYYARQQWAHKRVSFHFLSVASLFNFVSMRHQVVDYLILDRKNLNFSSPAYVRALYRALDELFAEDHFVLDLETGMVDVSVVIRQEVFDEFPPSFYDKPEVEEYVRANPKYRQGHDLCYSYPWSFVNVTSSLLRVLQQDLRNFYPRLHQTSTFLSRFLPSHRHCMTALSWLCSSQKSRIKSL